MRPLFPAVPEDPRLDVVRRAAAGAFDDVRTNFYRGSPSVGQYLDRIEALVELPRALLAVAVHEAAFGRCLHLMRWRDGQTWGSRDFGGGIFANEREEVEALVDEALAARGLSAAPPALPDGGEGS